MQFIANGLDNGKTERLSALEHNNRRLRINDIESDTTKTFANLLGEQSSPIGINPKGKLSEVTTTYAMASSHPPPLVKQPTNATPLKSKRKQRQR